MDKFGFFFKKKKLVELHDSRNFYKLGYQSIVDEFENIFYDFQRHVATNSQVLDSLVR